MENLLEENIVKSLKKSMINDVNQVMLEYIHDVFFKSKQYRVL